MTAFSSGVAAPATMRSEGLKARIFARGELEMARVRAMFDLYAAHYADTSEEIFRRDLAQKTHVLLLTHEDGRLRGFTTIESYRSAAATVAPVHVLFSGDTIVDPDRWGSQLLALEWLRFAGGVARSTSLPLYWLLIVKGHRTYRFLPAFARRYIPHHESPGSPGERNILAALAREKFGDRFDDITGIVRFPSPQGRLADELAVVPEQHRRLPAVAHFLKLNPGYRSGDELVCLCRLAPENLRPFAARAFAQDPDSESGF